MKTERVVLRQVDAWGCPRPEGTHHAHRYDCPEDKCGYVVLACHVCREDWPCAAQRARRASVVEGRRRG